MSDREVFTTSDVLDVFGNAAKCIGKYLRRRFAAPDPWPPEIHTGRLDGKTCFTWVAIWEDEVARFAAIKGDMKTAGQWRDFYNCHDPDKFDSGAYATICVIEQAVQAQKPDKVIYIGLHLQG